MSYERQDASLRVIAISSGVLVALVLGSVGISAWMYWARFSDPKVYPATSRQTSFHHGPDERLGIVADYEEMKRRADERLHGYGWTDHQNGLARIPIERAMALLAAGVEPPRAPEEPGQIYEAPHPAAPSGNEQPAAGRKNPSSGQQPNPSQ